MRFAIFCFLIFIVGCKIQHKPIIPFTDKFENFSQNWIIENHTFESNLATFNPNNVKLNNGVALTLNQANADEKPYHGAEIRSRKLFKYGKFTARIKAPRGGGMVSGFFLYNPQQKESKEIDIEFLGNNEQRLTLNHWVNSKSNAKVVAIDLDFSKDYNNYTIEWRKDFIAWSVNGQEIYRTTTAIPQVPLKVVFNIWVSKYENWAGKFKETALPANFYITEVTYYP